MSHQGSEGDRFEMVARLPRYPRFATSLDCTALSDARGHFLPHAPAAKQPATTVKAVTDLLNGQ